MKPTLVPMALEIRVNSASEGLIFMNSKTAQIMPDILDYDSALVFLKELIEKKRLSTAGFSLRQLAARAGFPSASLLSLILSGKRSLSEQSAIKLANALQLQGRRRKYFTLLCRLTSKRSEEFSLSIKRQLLQIRSSVDSKTIEAAQYRFLSNWYAIVVYVLIGQSDFNEDLASIRKKLKNSVSVEEIERIINDLESLGLIVREGGKLKQTHAAISTGEDVREPAVFSYHQQMIELAKDALKMPSKHREFNGITVTIPPSQVGEVKKRFRQFRKELNEYLSQFSEPSIVYQINLQLFPLTEVSEVDV